MGEKNLIEVERLIDIKELSKVTGLSKGYLEKSYREANLPYYKLGRSVRFRVGEVQKWIKERQV